MNYERENERQEEVFTKVVRAGKRTYFFDIKATKGNDFYVTITESKKQLENGKNNFQKHKVFLYKEDFEKFIDSLQEVVDKARELQTRETTGSPSHETVTFDEL